jgi:oxygen-independent coproporphyrinogen-3 oxidase
LRVISSDPGFGLYVHWPFCRAKCPYCDFNSHVRHGGIDAMVYAKALTEELRWFRDLTGPKLVSSIFFGGGTPSLMPPAAVARVIDAVARLWLIEPDAEITLEANPTSTEAGNFRGFRSAGVNRVSVGVQALNDPDLIALGRQHTAAEGLAAFRLAASIFPRVSLDLIYARPGQTADGWESELYKALAEQQGHMSLYQLTVEPGTAYAELHARGLLQMPDEPTAAALYDLTQSMTDAAGLRAYEVSNHAFPGQESRHNLIYWHYGEYAGVGPGAHSRIGSGSSRQALATEKQPEAWVARVAEKGSGVASSEVITPEAQAMEYLLMGLRIADGIDHRRYAELGGKPLDERRLSAIAELGLIDRRGEMISATPAGRRVLNSLIAELVG